jgi:3-hydroxybutyryl-CoA dehydratase
MNLEECEFEFTITRDEMKLFSLLSGDDSLIHTDDAFARENGYRESIVYGGILLAKLSCCLGRHLPGPRGVSLSWSIRYHAPLYIGETAVFRASQRDYSPAMNVLSIEFVITKPGQKVAAGTAQSLILGQSEAP